MLACVSLRQPNIKQQVVYRQFARQSKCTYYYCHTSPYDYGERTLPCYTVNRNYFIRQSPADKMLFGLLIGVYATDMAQVERTRNIHRFCTVQLAECHRMSNEQITNF